MKYRHLFWGIILISVGLLFLLANLGVLHFSWLSFWRLWPVIFILWGVSILPIKDIFRFSLLVLVLIATFVMINRMPERSPFYWHHQHNGDGWHLNIMDDDDTVSGNFRDQNLSVPFDSLSLKGILKLEAAAGNFSIDSSTADFLSFSKSGDIGNYELSTDNEGSRKEISLSMQEDGTYRRMNKNNVNIRLNEKPSWDMDLDIGAASVVMDLKKYRIDTAEIKAGAASVEMTLGDLNPLTVLEYNAGASSFTLRIPSASGCQVTSESFLASREFEGFEKKGERLYQTPNFKSSKNKIYVTVKTAVSSIRIERY